ncbi:hypothetical protein FKR81_40480 [Lentzea tibetensis]|uniref:Uncharacterized protein n=1 Tax=Lentzea tibetensis TaxID=2591470 RepID=A0A563EFV0_9PSEU|nr:hypothetical protein [Lentzea tibetensis]TWP44962.1 hypothetical protein FKR81_40480 [Lentzea tibetensis]
MKHAQSNGDDLAALVAVATAGLLISPVSRSHHWAWAGPAFVLLSAHARKALLPVALVLALGPHWLLPYTQAQELRPWADFTRPDPATVVKLVSQLRGRFGVEPILRVLGIASSTYYG